MPWEPILQGALAERARHAIRRIADDLVPAKPNPAELVLFHFYAEHVLGDELAAAHEAAVEALAASFAAAPRRFDLFGGVAGTGFVVAHCLDSTRELLDGVDRVALELLDSWDSLYDLIGGLVGFAVYFLEREDSPTARRGLELVVERLVDTAERSDAGITWFTPNDWLVGIQRGRFPNGCYDCGVAHGVPGVIAILGKLAARADAPAAVPELFHGALRWLASIDRGPGAASRFPNCIADGRAEPARTAWCYGDPGVGVALWNAKLRAGLAPDDAIVIAKESLAREHRTSLVVDAMVCHGASGLGHLANRCFQASRDPMFRDHAIRWFEHALDDQGDTGIGGFVTIVDLGPPKQFGPMPDLLDGSIGLGLALVAGLTTVEPDWDRLFLVDLPCV